MCSADNDDVFPLAFRPDGGTRNSILWASAIYPYTKSLDVLINPQGFVATGPVKYFGNHYGVVPRAEIKRANTSQNPYYEITNGTLYRAQFAGIPTNSRYQGIFGWGWDAAGPGCWGAAAVDCGRPINIPSKSQSQLSRVAETLLMADANDPLMTFMENGYGVEIGYCVDRRGNDWRNWDVVGAIPRWNGGPKDCSTMSGTPNTAPDYGGRVNMGKGMTTALMADGSVKAMSLPRLYKGEPCANAPGFNCVISMPVE